MSDAYTLFEHRHRFSVWAAARAAQRGLKGANSGVMIGAFERCGWKRVVERRERWPATPKQFDALHRKICRKLIGFLTDAGLRHPTYGRAAKLTAIYLKSMIINGPDAHSSFAGIIHPPIDRVLLRNLAACKDHPNESCGLWREISWTSLDEPTYFALINGLRQLGLDRPAFWMIERFWSAADE